MKHLLSITFAIVFILHSCAPRIYQDPNAVSIAQNQKIIAILPPSVSISAKKNVDSESLKEQQKTESINFQKEMYSWLLKRKMQGKLNIEIQDVEVTNALLNKYSIDELKAMTPIEFGKITNTDGIVKSNFAISKPLSTGGAIAIAVFTGVMAPTDNTIVDLSLYDIKSEKMIWNYNHKASGSFTNAGKLVDQLMKNASKKFPHIQK